MHTVVMNNNKTWMQALKEWNATVNKSDAWCIPRKGTKEYKQVRKLMGDPTKKKISSKSTDVNKNAMVEQEETAVPPVRRSRRIKNRKTVS